LTNDELVSIVTQIECMVFKKYWVLVFFLHEILDENHVRKHVVFLFNVLK
jgi:hypothetical protein